MPALKFELQKKDTSTQARAGSIT
ncbi:MAG: hypothetical protein RIQ50_88, partial [Bacteroidota bacterium]